MRYLLRNSPSTIIFTVIILSLAFSCGNCGLHSEVDYQYNGITIRRIDVCGKTTFYYQNDEGISNGRIWVEYSGINDGFSGYLVFKDNGVVSLQSGDGYFQIENIDTTLFSYKRIYAYNRPKLGENVCVIMLATNVEQNRNIENKSGVETTYRIDKNKWW